jgi:PAS domain S-box-containing protein
VLAATVGFYTAGTPYDVEYRLIRADGSVIWVHDQAVVVRYEAGKPLYSQGFWVDITERKRLEEALHARETELAREKQYFESLVEVSPVAVVTMDAEERVTGWNPAATLLFGYLEDEAVGRTITELVLDSEDLPPSRHPTHEALAAARRPCHEAQPKGRLARRRRGLDGAAPCRRPAPRLLRHLPGHNRAQAGRDALSSPC